ncbi:MAG TPA: recombination mediator RecR [Patescibacteria group bacterium]|jgi:recombination protein RecR|nr:recombination mediator RecR [Patescibacteria group bacterium]
MKPLSEPLSKLMEALQKLPGIGGKSAQRLAFHVLKVPRHEVEALAAALLDVKDKVAFCSVCCNIADHDPCAICDEPSRDRTMICVVEDPGSVMVIEKTGKYKGLYHVLHGALSPMHGVGPDQLRVSELLRRLEPGSSVREVIVATNPNVDGEATAVYLSRLIRPLAITVSRIGMGLPVGSEIDYADDVTIARALDGRRAV